jgi:hypothetical protein
MLDLRIYRAAFAPVILALVVVAFSLQTRPAAITTALPPDAFAADRAYRLLDDLATRYPSRQPGSAGDMALAGLVQRTFAATDFQVTSRDFDAETIDGKRTLRTVVAERPGRVNRRIVVLAHRDAATSPARAELSATATLLELARLFAGRTTRRTLTLVSTSGGSGGDAGAADWAAHVSGPVDAVIVLGDMATVDQRRPQVVGWSNARGIAPRQLIRSVEAAVREESGGSGTTRTTMQALRLGFPLSVSEQGVINAHGLPAVLVGQSGELGPAGDAAVSEARMEAMGRSVLRSITALDEGTEVMPDAPQSVVLLRNQIVPLWAIRLLCAVLLLPPLLAAVDGLARVRRRRETIAGWLVWGLLLGSPFLAAGLGLRLLRLLGVVTAPGAPVAPGVLPVSVGTVVVGAMIVLLGFLLSWPALRHRAGESGGGGAGIAAGLMILALTAVIWVWNPFAALFLIPAVHLWLLAVAPEVRVPSIGRGLLVLLALLPFGLAFLAYMVALHTGPVALAWMGVLLVAGGHVSIVSLLLWSAVAGTALAALIAALHTSGAQPSARGGRGGPIGGEPVRSRGPIGYAGPGSLGGTDSALRR